MSTHQNTPIGWFVGRIDEFFVLQRGFDLTENEAQEGTVPVISSGGISYYHDVAKVQPPGVVTGRKGRLGSVFYVEEPFWPHDTTLWVKDFKGNEPKFVQVFLQNLQLESFDAATSVPTLNRNNVHSLLVSFPPMPEQRKIAAILSTWDEAIALTEQLVGALQRRKQALMQMLLTGTVRFGEFEGSAWEEVQLGEIVTLINGRAFKPHDWKDSGLPIIRIQNLNGSNEFNYYDQEVQEKYYVESGDLLFSWSGSRGTSFGPHIWNGSRGILNQHIFRVEHTEAVQRSYLFSALMKITAELEHSAHGSAGLVHVTKPELERVNIFLPAPLEQESISGVISCAEEESNILNRQLDYLQTQKRGLMQQLLTGAVRV